MISIVNYLMEGKVLEHIKRNWGKYAVGAGVAALAEPEISYRYHKAAIKSLADDIESGNTNLEQKLRKGLHALHHADKAESANERNLINKRDSLWTEPPETKEKIRM